MNKEKENTIDSEKNKELEKKDKKDKNKEENKKGEVTISKEEYHNLKNKIKELENQKERMLRVSAEYENAKKRLQKEKEDFVKFANEKLVSKLLTILDDFERALDSADQGHNLENVIEGVKMIKSQFFSVLKESGLEKIKAKNEKFDPNFHEAVDFTETDEYKNDTVIEVFQPGYLFKGRLVRPSVVKIAKSPKEEKKEKEKSAKNNDN